MSRPENSQTAKRKLSLVAGKTYAVTLPIKEVERLGWEKGEDLIVRRMKNYIIIQKEDELG